MKNNILKLSDRKLDIEHIGSTAIKGLGGKGIIDILIGIKNWKEAVDTIKILKKLGFKHFHKIENHCLFASTQRFSEEGDFHVHIGRKSTKQYANMIAFRDYLRHHPKEVRRYAQIKKASFEKCKHDRKLYKKLKNNYFLALDLKKQQKETPALAGIPIKLL